MSKKVVQCPGSGTSVALPTTKNPKVDCPRCSKRVGVMHSGKIRKHMSIQKI